MRACLIPFFLGVLPRLCYTGFVFTQPFLLHTLIDTIETLAVPNQGITDRDDRVNSLIISVAAVYIGIAISKACYSHMAYRLLTLIRGGLTGLIFQRALRLPGHTGANGDFGAMTLMSTDIDTIMAVSTNLHDLWASFLEIPLAVYLLYRQTGVAALTVLAPTLRKSMAMDRHIVTHPETLQD